MNSKPPQDRRISVVAFNIAGWNILQGRKAFSLDQQAALLKKLDPDVVCLQEVVRFTGGNEDRADSDRVAKMAQLLGLKHFAFFKPPNGKVKRWPKTYGLAVISRWPITNFKAHELPVDDRPGYPRHLLETTIKPDNGIPPVNVCSVHLQHSRQAGQNDRERAAKFINALYARNKTTPTIIAGDFNAGPTNPAMQLLTETGVWTDATKFGIDAVIYRPSHSWRTISTTKVPHQGASDHDPVRAILRYTGK